MRSEPRCSDPPSSPAAQQLSGTALCLSEAAGSSPAPPARFPRDKTAPDLRFRRADAAHVRRRKSAEQRNCVTFLSDGLRGDGFQGRSGVSRMSPP
ncbi:hypothetical protein AOLI_G00027930 [Acnodon oligacanthus]